MKADYQSSLADHMLDFITFQRAQGYTYTTEVRRLRLFDRFLVDSKYTAGRLQSEVMHEYCATTSGKSINTRAKLHSIVRLFSLHLHIIDPQSAMLPASMVSRKVKKTRYYPLSPLQIQELMNTAGALRPVKGLRPYCIRFMIGLLYCTGLRISEALALNLKDVDATNRTLFVHRGKFKKDRIISMSDSTYEALKQWLKVRSRYAGNAAKTPLLVTEGNKRLTYYQASSAFRKLCVCCDLVNTPRPRLHDLRHNYACQCIAVWRAASEDISALLPVLANAMGHVNFSSTQVYVHIDAEALRQASVKFNQHFKHSLGKTL